MVAISSPLVGKKTEPISFAISLPTSVSALVTPLCLARCRTSPRLPGAAPRPTATVVPSRRRAVPSPRLALRLDLSRRRSRAAWCGARLPPVRGQCGARLPPSAGGAELGRRHTGAARAELGFRFAPTHNTGWASVANQGRDDLLDVASGRRRRSRGPPMAATSLHVCCFRLAGELPAVVLSTARPRR